MRILKFMMTFAVLTAVSGAAMATDQTLTSAVGKGVGLMVALKTAVSAAFILAGAYWSGKGLLEVIKATQQRSDESPLNGLAKCGLGVALIALPWVSGMTANTFFGSSGQDNITKSLKSDGNNF